MTHRFLKLTMLQWTSPDWTQCFRPLSLLFLNCLILQNGIMGYPADDISFISPDLDDNRSAVLWNGVLNSLQTSSLLSLPSHFHDSSLWHFTWIFTKALSLDFLPSTLSPCNSCCTYCQRSFFLFTTLLGYNSQTTKFTQIKCTIQWLWVQLSSQSILGHFHYTKRHPASLSHHSPTDAPISPSPR